MTVKQYPNTTILSAVTLVSAVMESSTRLVHYKWTRIYIGEYAKDANESSALEFVQLLTSGGIKDAKAVDSTTLQVVTLVLMTRYDGIN